TTRARPASDDLFSGSQPYTTSAARGRAEAGGSSCLCEKFPSQCQLGDRIKGLFPAAAAPPRRRNPLGTRGSPQQGAARPPGMFWPPPVAPSTFSRGSSLALVVLQHDGAVPQRLVQLDGQPREAYV